MPECSSPIDKILSPLNDVQREVVTYCDGPMLVLAGAGSGKTRAVTHKIAYLMTEKRFAPHRILAVTFTNKAAGEMRHRLQELAGLAAQGLEMGTFHSVCAKLLRKHAALVGRTSSYTIYDEDDAQSIMRKVVRELKLDPKKFAPRPLLSSLEGIRNALMSIEEWASGGGYRDGWRGNAARIFDRYEEMKQSLNGVDFNDLLYLMHQVLAEHDDVRKVYNDRYEYVLVDEMQDTNHMQMELLRLLLAPHQRICAVGDDDQSIYAWRGARVENMLEFDKVFPGTRIMRMEQNYRSTRTILDAAHSVIRNNRSRHEKKLWTDNVAGQRLQLVQSDSEGDEASMVAKRVAALVKEGVQLRQMAVFFRTNAQSRSFEETFSRKGIPHVVVGGMRFYERAEVKDALAYLRLLANPKDDVSFGRVINNPPRGIGDVALQKLSELSGVSGCSMYEAALLLSLRSEEEKWAQAIVKAIKLFEGWKEKAQSLPVAELARTVLEESGYLGRLESSDAIQAESRQQNLDQLVGSILDVEGTEEPGSLSKYLEYVSLVTDVDLWKSERERIPLMTVHAAKGLEFDVVFVTGLEDDLFPHENHSDDGEVEEERRLLYVALTRARKQVFLSFARSRLRYGGHTYPIPSRFLEEIGEDFIQAESPAPRRSFSQALHRSSPYSHGRAPSYSPGGRAPSDSPGGRAPSDSPGGRAPSDSDPLPPRIRPAAPAGMAGKRVQHGRHGRGMVLAFVGQAAVPLCVVKFDSGALVTVRADTLERCDE